MPDYSQSKIYRIIPTEGGEDGDVYFGSTTKPLNVRLSNHRSDFRHNQLNTTSHLLFEKFGEDGVKIELIETCPVDCKKDLLIRERFYIENNDCVNRKIPGRDQAESKREYNKKNAEKIKAYHAAYHAANKEEISRKKLENRYIPGRGLAEGQREYKKKNAEKLKAYNAAYCAANKDEINRKMRERYATKKAALMDLEKT